MTKPFIDTLNWAKGLNAKGQPVPDPAKYPAPDGVLVSPNSSGATSVAPAQAPVTYVKAPTVVKYEHAPTRTATTTRSSSDDGSSDDGAETGGDD